MSMVAENMKMIAEYSKKLIELCEKLGMVEEKKPNYPKSFEECCEIIGFDTLKWNNPFCVNRDTHPYIKHLDNLMEGFCKLLICRDAYWKIAGDWKANWNTNIVAKYCIGACMDRIEKHLSGGANYILAFPTEEMRDVFYENFKYLIEECKELI